VATGEGSAWGRRRARGGEGVAPPGDGREPREERGGGARGPTFDACGGAERADEGRARHHTTTPARRATKEMGSTGRCASSMTRAAPTAARRWARPQLAASVGPRVLSAAARRTASRPSPPSPCRPGAPGLRAGDPPRSAGPAGPARSPGPPPPSDAGSGPCRSRIPEHADHRFRPKAITDSGATRSLNA
jgi:hypothetical protein